MIELVKEIAVRYGTNLEEMRGSERMKNVVEARREVAKHLRLGCGWSLQRIGVLLHRHHTTILTIITPKGSKEFDMSWTQEMKDELRRCVRELKMTPDTARLHVNAKFDKSFSVNAIIGATHRLGLNFGNSVTPDRLNMSAPPRQQPSLPPPLPPKPVASEVRRPRPKTESSASLALLRELGDRRPAAKMRPAPARVAAVESRVVPPPSGTDPMLQVPGRLSAPRQQPGSGARLDLYEVPCTLNIWHPIMSLGPRKCRWPRGNPRDPGFCFCLHPIVGDSSYCRHHARESMTLAGWSRFCARNDIEMVKVDGDLR